MEGLTPAPAAYRELLRQKLADAAHRIQWTYSIFWSFSPEQQLLVWGEGYLNGADSAELSLRRSRRLQELFVAMNANRGAAPQSSEASAGVSVALQDLTPPEWFYMYSMACSYATGFQAEYLRRRSMYGSVSPVRVTPECVFVAGLLSDLKYRQWYAFRHWMELLSSVQQYWWRKILTFSIKCSPCFWSSPKFTLLEPASKGTG